MPLLQRRFGGRWFSWIGCLEEVIVVIIVLSSSCRAFVGSTSDYVVHHSPCPVLVVKHPETTNDGQ